MFLHENFGTVKFWYCLCNCICYLPSALPSNKVRWLLTHVVLRDPWQIQTIIFLLPHCLWPPKLARWRLSWIYSILWSRENNYISTTTNSMATELGSIVTYFKGLLPFKLQDSYVTWSFGITWQTKIIISPLPQCLEPLNMEGWWLSTCESHT